MEQWKLNELPKTSLGEELKDKLQNYGQGILKMCWKIREWKQNENEKQKQNEHENGNASQCAGGKSVGVFRSHFAAAEKGNQNKWATFPKLKPELKLKADEQQRIAKWVWSEIEIETEREPNSLGNIAEQWTFRGFQMMKAWSGIGGAFMFGKQEAAKRRQRFPRQIMTCLYSCQSIYLSLSLS